MRLEIERESSFIPTFKTESLKAKFDLQVNTIKEKFELEYELPESWNVGVIYGASGTGKTTILRHLFGDRFHHKEYTDKPVIEDISPNHTVDEITEVFNKVGFSSPPSWLKPYRVLSNGEKMRVDLCEALLHDDGVIVFDEFTSVVDRQVAKICSYAVAKHVRKFNRQIVLASCHEDVLDWLEPDWCINTDEMRFLAPRSAGADIKDPQSKSTSERQLAPRGACLESITI